MDEENELLNVSMEIILHAGNARNAANKAIFALKNRQYEKANQLLNQAREDIRKAHVSQTEVIQAEARGESHEPSLLFTHAQDTLMTIMSEINIYENIVMLFTDREN